MAGWPTSQNCEDAGISVNPADNDDNNNDDNNNDNDIEGLKDK